MNPVFQEERLCFERLWTRVLQRRIEENPDTRIIFVPEYGYELKNIPTRNID